MTSAPMAEIALSTASMSGPKGDAAISVRGLRKCYGSFEAVTGISFDVARGEIVALLGPNGAGKTTTVEILEGFRERSSGDVLVLGQDPQTAPLMWRDRIGVVLQESEVEPDLTARECVELYAGYHLHPRPVIEVLELVGLLEKANTRGSRLSGGQRRRLDVALALIGDPELVFLDEPTTGFDPSARRQAWDTIDGLRQLGKTIFLTTHYMEEAERLADRIMVVARGAIVAEGTPRNLANRDTRPANVSFQLPGQATLENLSESLRSRITLGDDNRNHFSSHDPLSDLATLSSWGQASDVAIQGLEVRQPTLEDVYLELTETNTPTAVTEDA